MNLFAQGPEEKDSGSNLDAAAALPAGRYQDVKEGDVNIVFAKNYGYRAIEVAGTLSALSVHCFHGWIERDCYCLIWPGQADLRAFVSAVGRLRKEAGADRASSDLPLGIGNVEAWGEIELVVRPEEPETPRALYLPKPPDRNESFSFDEAGEEFWRDPEEFLRKKGIETPVTMTIQLSAGLIQFNQGDQGDGSSNQATISFRSHYEIPGLIGSAMQSTHAFPLEARTWVSVLAHVINGYRARHQQSFP